ncbi:50s ribosomal subunit maturation gtpase rbga [hydrocarbon metagenome]|uniref:50s ribosomal subunit maturation gtpase rbga n=1 Tax=hydrocarbon metagenome TaxID=938273 RepID=A0A0W8E7N5_9ZZZZ
MSINWYPGHMVKARREIEKNLKMVDMVLILLDARAPFSCRNIDLERMASKKSIIMILSKVDLADPSHTRKYVSQFLQEGIPVATINSINSKGSKEVFQVISDTFREQADKMRARGRRVRAVRVMVAGVPNAGKSTFLNCLVGKKVARTGATPGVTRGQQWIRIREDIELMDTPGLMWPKIENETQGKKLALLSIVGENAYQEYEVALFLLEVLKEKNPDILLTKLKLKNIDKANEEILDDISILRGHLLKEGRPDTEKTCKLLLQDFRKGRLGRISLD